LQRFGSAQGGVTTGSRDRRTSSEFRCLVIEHGRPVKMKYLPISSTECDAIWVDNHAIIAVARGLQLEAAMVIIDGIALAAVAIALGRVFACPRPARPTRRGLIERFGEYGASRSSVSSVQ
jgi:hypothetical protein